MADPKVTVRVEGDSTGYDRTIDDALNKTKNIGQQFKQVGSNLSQLGRTMTAMFTVPIVGAAALVGNEFVSLDTKMQNIQSIAQDLSDRDIANLRQQLIDMSKDEDITTESASALADAFYFIQSAGYDLAHGGLDVLAVSTKAASAGLTDTNTAANAIMGVLHAYNMEADQAGHVSDVLFKTVDAGVITFEDLAGGLGRITNTAAVAGISLEEIGASMVVLTRKGMPAAEAFTALNQVMSKLAAPTEKIKQAAKDLGIDISYTALKSKGFVGVLDEIVKKDKDGEVMFELFGNNVRALKGILGLTSEELATYTDALDDMKTASDGAGRTQMAFEQQTKSIDAQIKFLKNDMMAVGMTLLEILMPYFTMFVGWLQKATDWLAKLSPTTQVWIVALLALLAVMGPLLMLIGGIVSGIGAIITVIGAISAPIWIVIGVIAALIAVVVLLYFAWKNNWLGIRDTTTEVLSYLKNLWTSFTDWFTQLTTGKLGVWSLLWTNTWNSIKLFFNGILTNLRLAQQAWHYAVMGDWYNFGATLRQIWDNNWSIMVQILKNAWINITNIFHSTVTSIKNWWGGIDWNSLGRDIGRGILNGLNNMGSALYNAIRNIARGMLQTFQGFWGISSPSKVMEDQFDYLAQGANIGWSQNFQFSPQAISNQMMSTYSSPTISGGGDNTRMVSLLEQLNNKDSRLDEGVLVRAFRDAVLLMRD